MPSCWGGPRGRLEARGPCSATAPSFETPARGGLLRMRPASLREASLLRLAGILHRLKSREFDVVEFPVDFFDLADVDVLHDVAGLRVDRDRAARAFPLHPLHCRDQRVAVGLAAGLLQRLVDQVNAVVAADRHEAGAVAKSL